MTGPGSRRRPARIAVLVTVLASGATVTGVAAAAREAEPRPATRDEVCLAYEHLRGALSLQGPVAPFAVRGRALRLAELAGRYPERPLRDSMPARQASVTIASVLAAPYATVRDLWAAARPVAVECGDDWREWSPSLDRLLGR